MTRATSPITQDLVTLPRKLPEGPVNLVGLTRDALREAFDDPQAEARQMRLLDTEGREHIGIPIKFAREPGVARLTLPALGEHNADYVDSPGAASH